MQLERQNNAGTPPAHGPERPISTGLVVAKKRNCHLRLFSLMRPPLLIYPPGPLYETFSAAGLRCAFYFPKKSRPRQILKKVPAPHQILSKKSAIKKTLGFFSKIFVAGSLPRSNITYMNDFGVQNRPPLRIGGRAAGRNKGSQGALAISPPPGVLRLPELVYGKKPCLGCPVEVMRRW